MIQLGDKVKCCVTGFSGIVTGRTEYLNGCIRYCVQGTTLKDGRPTEAEWIDAGQLSVSRASAVSVARRNTGGPMPTPKREATPR